MDRLLEIDLLKGIAVIFMMTFHVFYLPKYIGIDIKDNSLFLRCIARISQFIFITLVGVNMTIANQRYKNKENKDLNKDLKDKKDNYYQSLYNKNYTFKQIVRVGYLLLTAALISLITYILFNDWYVKFGIIHFVAVSLLILFKFVNNDTILMTLNVLIVGLWSLKTFNDNSFGLYKYFSWVPDKIAFITGLFNPHFKAMDHFPLIPWLSVMINGIYIGKLLYKNGERKYDFLEKINDIVKKDKSLNLIGKLGKYSYRVYLIHYVLIYIFYKCYKEIVMGGVSEITV